MVHAVRAAMQSLRKTGTDFSSAQGMDPKAFFEVMGQYSDTFSVLSTPTQQFYNFQVFKRLSNLIIELVARLSSKSK